MLDRDIPFIEEIFSGIGEIVAVSGHEIGPDVVDRADALIVRSITRIDKNLLSSSSVRFVGSATAGIDHLDTEFLSASGIHWANAPGANARSVVEYVLAAISVIAGRRGKSVRGKTLGVIGCGQVGERLCRTAEAMGLRVLRNDPPRAQVEGSDSFVDLDTCVRHSDILSVHTPLTDMPPFATRHLLDERTLEQAKPGAWLVHAARGCVVEEAAALLARKEGRLGALVLDVFDGEPLPGQQAILIADLATGHIAGYSRDAKRAGAEMMRDAVVAHFGLGTDTSHRASASHAGPALLTLPESCQDPMDPEWMDAVVRQVYDIRDDDRRFREVMKATDAGTASEEATRQARARAFHEYRATYPARYTWSRYEAAPRNQAEAAMLSALGFRTVSND